MTKKYITIAIILSMIVIISYIFNFYFVLKYEISDDTAVWGQFSDYAGGLLNPILSFISILLIVESLKLQQKANSDLSDEVKSNAKIEKVRSFEIIFFHMIEQQKKLLEYFSIIDHKEVSHRGRDAIIFIEDSIATMRKKSNDDIYISSFIKQIDENEDIFILIRSFYVALKLISDKLSNENGFDTNERMTHISILINLTDFAFLRLLVICMQFLDYSNVKYIKSHQEFKKALECTGVKYDIY